MDWQNVLERAAWTFAQSAIVFILASEADLLSANLWVGAALAGAAAALSVLKTVAQERLDRWRYDKAY